MSKRESTFKKMTWKKRWDQEKCSQQGNEGKWLM